MHSISYIIGFYYCTASYKNGLGKKLPWLTGNCILMNGNKSPQSSKHGW